MVLSFMLIWSNPRYGTTASEVIKKQLNLYTLWSPPPIRVKMGGYHFKHWSYYNSPIQSMLQWHNFPSKLRGTGVLIISLWVEVFLYHRKMIKVYTRINKCRLMCGALTEELLSQIILKPTSLFISGKMGGTEIHCFSNFFPGMMFLV